jgi:hypothetical protein
MKSNVSCVNSSSHQIGAYQFRFFAILVLHSARETRLAIIYLTLRLDMYSPCNAVNSHHRGDLCNTSFLGQ